MEFIHLLHENDIHLPPLFSESCTTQHYAVLHFILFNFHHCKACLVRAGAPLIFFFLNQMKTLMLNQHIKSFKSINKFKMKPADTNPVSLA